MSITVNTNMSSIIAQRSLYKATNKMNTALERLSTGLRINSAEDDAAGSAISTKLEYKMSSYDVAKDNAQMGQSMLDTANGTLTQINSMLQRIRDLSEQASNGTYGEDERKAMQAEIDGLTEEIYRIKNTTEFNGKKILGEEERDYTKPTMSINDIDLENLTQAEWDSNYKGQVFGISNAKELQKLATIVNDKKINTTDTTFALTADIDLNELEMTDEGNWTAIGSRKCLFRGIFNGNNHTISNLKINKPNDELQGLFGYSSKSTIKNLNVDNADIVGYYYIGGIVGAAPSTTIDNVNFSGNVGSKRGAVGGLVGELSNGKINNCIIKLNKSSSSISYWGGIVGQTNNDNIFSNCFVEAEFNKYAGIFIGQTAGNTKTTFNNCKSNQNSNNIPEIKLEKGTIIKTNIEKSINVPTNLQIGIDTSENSKITINTGFCLDDFNISVANEDFARIGLNKIDNLMSKITDKLTDIGSTQNRLISTMEFQEVQRNALTSANSLIKDADIAEESANYIKNQILQNVTSTLLSTANQNPSIALQLI